MEIEAKVLTPSGSARRAKPGEARSKFRIRFPAKSGSRAPGPRCRCRLRELIKRLEASNFHEVIILIKFSSFLRFSLGGLYFAGFVYLQRARENLCYGGILER